MGENIFLYQFAYLGGKDIEVACAVGSADEFTLILGRHTRILGNPHYRWSQAVGVEAEAVEGLALLLTVALACMEERRRKGRSSITGVKGHR